MIKPHRKNALWIAYFAHRVSGLLLALFLPVHFYVLSLTLSNQHALDGFLKWADNPLVKLAETGLVFLLAVHFFGGLRLLALEFLPWSQRQKTFVALGFGVSFFIACGFALRAF